MTRRKVDLPAGVVQRLVPTSGTWGRIYTAAPAGTSPYLAYQTEAQLDAAEVEFCQRFGFATYHTHDSQRSEAGFPDRCIDTPDMLWVLENKGWQPGRKRYGTPTLAQTDWLTSLDRKPSITARLVYPWQWPALATEILRSAGKL